MSRRSGFSDRDGFELGILGGVVGDPYLRTAPTEIGPVKIERGPIAIEMRQPVPNILQSHALLLAGGAHEAGSIVFDTQDERAVGLVSGNLDAAHPLNRLNAVLYRVLGQGLQEESGHECPFSPRPHINGELQLLLKPQFLNLEVAPKKLELSRKGHLLLIGGVERIP